MSAARDSLSADELFLAGGVSGIVECLTVQPFDMAKTRLHLMSPGTRPSLIGALSGLVAEGGVFRLYRGILPELTAMTPKSSAMYASYDGALRILRPQLGESSSTHFVAGFISGLPEAITVTPFQLVKVRLQAKEHLQRYSGTFDCLRRVLVEEGAATLFIGLHATIWRNCVWNSVYFALMHALRPEQPSGDGGAMGTLLSSARTLTTGFVCGVIATCFNNPFDVVKSRLQAELGGVTKGGRQRPVSPFNDSSVAGRLGAILRTEGAAGLYAGFSAKAMRMGVGGAVGMAAYESTAAWLAKRRAVKD